MRLDFKIPRLGKASPTAVLYFNGGLRQRPGVLLWAGTLALTLLVAGQILFPALISAAQTPDCYRGPFPPDEKPQYFPTGAFGVLGPFTAALYACTLRAMDERPSIPPAAIAVPRVYRLSVTPTWAAPFVVRLDVRADGTGMLVRKQARSELVQGPLAVNDSQDISKEQVEVFESLLNKAAFWSMPTILTWDRDPRVRLRVMGGVVWVLEGAKSDTYHVVTRTLPGNPAGPYAELTSYLFRDLARFEIPSPPTYPRKHKG